ncbi:MAG: zinc-ribbon domain-containing protein [Thermodesulfobacteriota bacterium]
MKAVCEHCGASYQIPDSKIPEKGTYATCSKCKNKFLVKPSPVTQPSNNETKTGTPCPGCGKNIPEQANFCPHCGASAKSPEEPEEGLQAEAETKEAETITCPKCGASQPPSAACQACGIIFAKFDKWKATPTQMLGKGKKKGSTEKNRGNLYTCPACGKQTSVHASTCVHCGDETRAEKEKDKTQEGLKNFAVGCASLIALIMFLSYLSGGENSSGPQKKQEAVPISTAASKWYAGGNLHRKKLSDWSRASYQNKLATCSDLAANLNAGKALFDKYGIDGLKPLSIQIMNCVDEVAKDTRTHNQSYAEVAAGCVVLMGYN